MTSAAFLLVCLAAGFYAGNKWKVSRVYVAKDAGHPLYFLSALMAAYLILFACAADQLIELLALREHISKPVHAVLVSVVPDRQVSQMTSLAMLTGWSVISSLLLSRLFNWPLNSNPGLLGQLAQKYGEREAIDDLIGDTYRLQLPALITLDDAKIYIGFVISGEPFGTASKRWLRLRPLFSGFRNSEKQLELTTDYQSVINILMDGGSDFGVAQRSFDVVVPFDRILSVHPFDLESYEQMFIAKEWSVEDQRQRLNDLARIAQGGEPDPYDAQSYWAHVGFVSLAPGLFLLGFGVLGLISLFLGLAFGVMAARPIRVAD